MSENQTNVTNDDIGKAIVFFDTYGQPHDALITNVFGPQCVNVVYVNKVEGQRDNYGQKLVRASSILHGNIQQAHGYYWMLPNEERTQKPPYVSDSAL